MIDIIIQWIMTLWILGGICYVMYTRGDEEFIKGFICVLFFPIVAFIDFREFVSKDEQKDI